MGKLIYAEALKESLGYYPMLTNLMIGMFTRIINEQEEVEIPAVKEGRWIPEGKHFECSRCWGVSKKATPYCPYCGSRNKEERHEEG